MICAQTAMKEPNTRARGFAIFHNLAKSLVSALPNNENEEKSTVIGRSSTACGI